MLTTPFVRRPLPLSASVLLACFFLIQQAWSQELKFGSFSIEDGLSVYSITEVMQDSKGLLWIGTVDGLNRYDGYTFKVYRNKSGDAHSLPDNYVNSNAIDEDEDGFLWIGTRGGLSRFDPRRDSFYTYTALDSVAHLSHNQVMDVMVSSTGQVWAATVGGLDVLDRKTNSFRHFNHHVLETTSLPSDKVLSLAEDNSGRIWVGTDAGICSIDPAGGEVKRYGAPIPVWSLMVDREGFVWGGGEQGQVQKLNPDTGEIKVIDLFAGRDIPSSNGFVIDMKQDKNGTVWVATYDGGLFSYEDGSWSQYTSQEQNNTSLPSNQISALLIDRSGKMWVGTWDGLAYVQSTKAFDNLSSDALLPLRATSVIESSSGAVWVGTSNKGLIRFSGGKVRQYTHGLGDAALSSNIVSSVLEDHAGKIWIGTSGGGVNVLHPGSNKIEKLLGTSMVYTIFQDLSHHIWIGTVRSGLYLYQPASNSFERYYHDPEDLQSLGSNEVWTIFEDAEQTLWVGTIGGGLNRMNIEESSGRRPSIKFERFVHNEKDPSSISSNNVVSFYQGEEGLIWIGTMGGGLNLLDVEAGAFTKLGVEEGLAHENVACILPDNTGNLWLPTTFGLSRLNLGSKTFNTYTLEDGLSGSVFALDGCAVGADGRLYLANNVDVTVFAPADILHNQMSPDPFITEIYLFNEPYEMDSSAVYKKELRLEYNQNFLAFQFSGTDYSIPQKNKYKYQLVGVDQDWVQDRGVRMASYPNLLPGQYNFKVLASNQDGIWSTDEANIWITIRKAYWQTWWFILLIVCLIVTGIGWVALNRYNQARHLEKTRQQIADDLHDDIGGKISGILLFLSRLQRITKFSEKDRKKAGYYTEIARRMVGDLRNLIWLADPVYDKLSALVEQIQKSKESVTSSADMKLIDLTNASNLNLPIGLRRHLFLIFYEALHNAVRHAGASSIITQLSLQERTLIVEVQDDGKGFDIETVNKGQGLHSMPRRAEEAGVQLSIDSWSGKGTTIKIEAKLT